MNDIYIYICLHTAYFPKEFNIVPWELAALYNEIWNFGQSNEKKNYRVEYLRVRKYQWIPLEKS
jgi:hypothetical protein